MKSSSLVVGFLATVLSLFNPVEAHADLSDILPLETVREMQNAKLWHTSFDDAATADGRELLEFVTTLTQSTSPVGTAINSIMLLQPSRAGWVTQSVRLYPIKYFILRSYRRHSARLGDSLQKRIKEFDVLWARRYVDVAAELVFLSGLDEVKAIVENFQRRLSSGEVTVRDLSPQERAQLTREIEKSHGVSPLDQNENGEYLITGLYSHQKNILAVDFARSLEENFVTLLHEIIHAADPNYAAHAKVFAELSPQVAALISGKLATTASSAGLSTEVLNFESVAEALAPKIYRDFTEQVRAAREARLAELSERVGSESRLTFTAEEKVLISKWMRSFIGITTENEYRAFGLSLIAYAKIKKAFYFPYLQSPPARVRELLNGLLAGDESFLNRIGVAYSPIQQLNGLLSKNLDLKERDHRIVLELFEMLYLNESQSFLKSLGQNFSRHLKVFEGLDIEQNPIPQWYELGAEHLPHNPHLLLTQKVSTSWTLAFTSNITQVNREVDEIIEPTLALSVGILDLHDLSTGKLQALGVHALNNPFLRVSRKTSLDQQKTFQSLSETTRDHFSPEIYDVSTALDFQIKPIDAQTFTDEMIKLRLIEAYDWLQYSLPPTVMSLAGMKAFLFKLQTAPAGRLQGLSDDRRKELIDEIVKGLEQSHGYAKKLIELDLLTQQIIELRQIALSRGLTQIAENFSALLTRLGTAFQQSSIEPTRDETLKTHKDLSATSLQLRAQIKILSQPCQNSDKRSPPVQILKSLATPVQMYRFTFSPVIICHRQKVYVLRMPQDEKDELFLMVDPEGLTTRIQSGGRPVRLSPFGDR